MLNTGQERYEDISVSDEKLLSAIDAGVRKHKRRSYRRIAGGLAAAAACIVLLFGCANISEMYVYASEIPILRTFLQAFRVGNGGSGFSNATPDIITGKNMITIAYREDGAVTDRVLSYSIKRIHAPSGLQMTFYGLDTKYGDLLEESLQRLDAAEDVYCTESEEGVTVVVILKELYHYEVMEFSDPGSMTVSFYKDAYYTQEEKHPGENVYFLRTEAAGSEKGLKRLLEKYEKEQPMQLKNKKGQFFLRIGEYESQKEAEEEYQRLCREYGMEQDFYVSYETMESIPD